MDGALSVCLCSPLQLCPCGDGPCRDHFSLHLGAVSYSQPLGSMPLLSMCRGHSPRGMVPTWEPGCLGPLLLFDATSARWASHCHCRKEITRNFFFFNLADGSKLSFLPVSMESRVRPRLPVAVSTAPSERETFFHLPVGKQYLPPWYPAASSPLPPTEQLCGAPPQPHRWMPWSWAVPEAGATLRGTPLAWETRPAATPSSLEGERKRSICLNSLN